MEYKVNKPYPKIKVEEKNIAYAKLLLNDYAGIISEETAINQYIYQSFNTFIDNQLLSKSLSEIAKTEMIHLSLLGKTIRMLGVTPKFKYIDKYTNNLICWNSSLIDYSTNTIEFLKKNILIEEKTINNYKNDIKIIKDKYIRKLIYRIIEDEKKHIECFNELLNIEKNLEIINL